MLKKSLLFAVVLMAGFAIKDFVSDGKIYWGELFLFFALAFVITLFIEWTNIPYSWNKQKNKAKNPE